MTLPLFHSQLKVQEAAILQRVQQTTQRVDLARAELARLEQAQQQASGALANHRAVIGEIEKLLPKPTAPAATS